ncbi:MAG: hypothetical protein B6244_08695 [Candidatus Cloacimonetes bacterium 4572_55]|nr:MAG: hypothetical protein B6244_08695 [Candidatus Cloacimonetes bacterium 4572_55]
MEDLKADQSSERQQEPNYPLETLLEISKAVNSTLNLDEIFQQITRQAVNVLMASRAVLFLRPAPDDDFVILMSEYDVRDLYESKNRGRYDLSKHTLNRKVMETLKPIQFHVDDLSADLEKSVRESLQELGVKSILMAPLILGDKAIGLFAVDQVGEIRVFTQGEIQLAQILANQAAIALKNAELFESVQKEKRRVEAIIHSSLDGIVVTDMQDVIIHVNPAFSNAFGVKN